MTCPQGTHPLDNTLAQFPGLNRAPADLPASCGPPTNSDWFLASDLPAEEKTLDELLKRFGAFMKTDSPFLQAALLMHPYTTPVVSVAVHGLYTAGRVPDVSAENLALRLDAAGEIVEHGFRSLRFAALASDSAASHPDATPAADFESLTAWLFDRMVEHHMRPLFSRVRAKTKLGLNVMWAALAGGCAETLMRLQRAGQLTIEEALAAESALLALAPRPMHDRVSVYPLRSGKHQELFMRLEVCCQKYLHPDMGKCGYCALRPVPEQLELQQYWFDRRVSEREGGARA